MKKIRYIAGVVPVATGLVALPAAYAGAAAGHAIQAKPTRTHTVSLHHIRGSAAMPEKVVSAGIIHGPAPLHARSGGTVTLDNGATVSISCYYSGAPWASDKYWDHVFREDSISGVVGLFTIVGHVADHYVNLGGRYPASVGIPHCG
jgi:hypothetical protein